MEDTRITSKSGFVYSFHDLLLNSYKVQGRGREMFELMEILIVTVYVCTLLCTSQVEPESIPQLTSILFVERVSH